MIRNLHDVNVKTAAARAKDYDLELMEVRFRGRGNGREFILVDEMGVCIAQLRIYERSFEILNHREHGTPYKVRSDGYGSWSPSHDSPADFEREADYLFNFYATRAAGLPGS